MTMILYILLDAQFSVDLVNAIQHNSKYILIIPKYYRKHYFLLQEKHL